MNVGRRISLLKSSGGSEKSADAGSPGEYVKSSIAHALATSALADVVVVLGATAALSVMTHSRSPEDFGAYAVSLRVLSLLQAPLLLGLGITLPRVLPSLASRRDRSETLLAALFVISVVTGLLITVALLVGGPIGTWLFDGAEYSGLIVPLALLIGASLLQATAYAFLRGNMRFTLANTLTALCLGVVPLAAALKTSGVTQYLLTLAICWSALSFAVVIPEFVRPSRLLDRAYALVRVGIIRVPGEFALFGLTAVPPLAVSATEGVTEAGQVSLAMSILVLAGTAVHSFSAVLLPHVSQWIEFGDYARLRMTVRRAVGAILFVFIPAVVVGELMAPWIMPIVFGETGAAAVPAVQAMLIAAPAFATFMILRSVIDGSTAKATTMNFAIVAFLSFCVVWPILSAIGFPPQKAILASTIVAWWLLAVLVLASIRNLLRRLQPPPVV